MSLKLFEEKAKAYDAPEFVTEDLIYMTVGGSRAYGVTHPKSDIDLYGICIPPKERVFPMLGGNIPGFGQPVPPWPHWAYLGEGVDIKVYGIVKFFNMAMQGNPNILEILFTEEHHIASITPLGEEVRGSRDLFLTDNIIPKFLGYYNQKKNHMFDYVTPEDFDSGYNRKNAYHSMRLLLQLEQLLETGRMDLGMYSDLLTAIRFGGYSSEDVKAMIEAKAQQVENKKKHSVLREKPNEEYIKQVLLLLLESHWEFTLDMGRNL